MLHFKKHINKTDVELYEIVKERTSKLVYHNFERVELLYKIVFGKDVMPFLDKIQKEENKRHNIVHRNGRHLNGELDKLLKEEVVSFLNNTAESIKGIWNLIKL